MTRCFLCNDRAKIFGSIEDLVPASQKPIKIVLQHLANTIKTKLIFETDTSVCWNCFQKLSDYDTLMLNLLKSQKVLTEQLKKALELLENETTELDDEADEIEEQLKQMEDDGTDDVEVEEFLVDDAFNPEFDANEEVVEMELAESVKDEYEEFQEFKDDLQDFQDFKDDFKYCDDDDDDDDDYIATKKRPNNATGKPKKRRSLIKCPECDVCCTSDYYLQIHTAKVHRRQQFICNICGAVRKDEEYLELHMNIHEGKTENECRYCDKKFARPAGTIRHMRMHWDNKKFQCDKCGERFSLDYMLYLHNLSHEAEENPFICTTCNQVFKSRKTYTRHLPIHQENRRRHSCTLCTKSFTERYTLKMHMKTHGERLPIEPKSKPVEKTKPCKTESSDKEQVCVICSTYFESKIELDAHLQSEHDVIIK